MKSRDRTPLPAPEFALATTLVDWLRFLNDDGSSLEEALIVAETYNCVHHRGFYPRQRDLRELTGLSKSTVSRHVGHLVLQGRFMLVADEDDARAMHIHLLPAETEHARRWAVWITKRQTQLITELLAAAVNEGQIARGEAETLLNKWSARRAG